MLTGESLPLEAGAGFDTYAGALVRRGEATAVVTATGARTKFGRTAELVRNRARRQLSRKGRPPDRAKSGHFQWCHDPPHRGLCLRSSCRGRKSFPFCSQRSLRRYRLRCLPPFTLAAAGGRSRFGQRWVSFRLGFLRWTKPPQ